MLKETCLFHGFLLQPKNGEGVPHHIQKTFWIRWIRRKLPPKSSGFTRHKKTHKTKKKTADIRHNYHNCTKKDIPKPIGSMYAIYGNINHPYTPNVSIYTIHGYTWILWEIEVWKLLQQVAADFSDALTVERRSAINIDFSLFFLTVSYGKSPVIGKSSWWSSINR